MGNLITENIKIPAGPDGSHLHATYDHPGEDGLKSMENLLLVMIHGFPGDKTVHNNMFNDLIFLLNDKSYHLLRYDARGCGGSDGRQEDFTLEQANEDLQNVLHWAEGKGYTRFVLIGEGLGAALAMMNLSKAVSCAVLLWPFLDLPRIAGHVFKADNLQDDWKKAGYMMMGKTRVGLKFIEELHQASLVKQLRKLETPLLVLHGAQDKVSPIDQLDLLRAHGSTRRIEITGFHDGEHGLTKPNHRRAMFYHMLQFIEKYT